MTTKAFSFASLLHNQQKYTPSMNNKTSLASLLEQYELNPHQQYNLSFKSNNILKGNSKSRMFSSNREKNQPMFDSWLQKHQLVEDKQNLSQMINRPLGMKNRAGEQKNGQVRQRKENNTDNKNGNNFRKFNLLRQSSKNGQDKQQKNQKSNGQNSHYSFEKQENPSTILSSSSAAQQRQQEQQKLQSPPQTQRQAYTQQQRQKVQSSSYNRQQLIERPNNKDPQVNFIEDQQKVSKRVSYKNNKIEHLIKVSENIHKQIIQLAKKYQYQDQTEENKFQSNNTTLIVKDDNEKFSYLLEQQKRIDEAKRLVDNYFKSMKQHTGLSGENTLLKPNGLPQPDSIVTNQIQQKEQIIKKGQNLLLLQGQVQEERKFPQNPLVNYSFGSDFSQQSKHIHKEPFRQHLKVLKHQSIDHENPTQINITYSNPPANNPQPIINSQISSTSSFTRSQSTKKILLISSKNKPMVIHKKDEENRDVGRKDEHIERINHYSPNIKMIQSQGYEKPMNPKGQNGEAMQKGRQNKDVSPGKKIKELKNQIIKNKTQNICINNLQNNPFSPYLPSNPQKTPLTIQHLKETPPKIISNIYTTQISTPSLNQYELFPKKMSKKVNQKGKRSILSELQIKESINFDDLIPKFNNKTAEEYNFGVNQHAKGNVKGNPIVGGVWHMSLKQSLQM